MAYTVNIQYMQSVYTFKEPIQWLQYLNSYLPDTVRLASEKDLIAQVFQCVVLPASLNFYWQTFNQFFDILFGKDIWNSNGCLYNILQGCFSINWLINELEVLM